MPVVDSYLPTSSVIGATVVGRPAWFENLPPVNSVAETFEIPQPPSTFSTVVNNLPVSLISEVVGGYLTASYADIFYERTLIEPSLLQLGNLLSNQSREITVFNAYRNQNKNLASITLLDGEGIEVTGPSTPINLLPLQELTYSISISLDGPPSINASIQFNFDDLEDRGTTQLVGSRIVIFPYIGVLPISEVLQWNTGIVTSTQGKEQRTSYRDKPRQRFSSSHYIGQKEVSRSENLLYGWRERIWAMPVWTEAVEVDNLTIGQTTIAVDTRYTDYRVGGLVLVWKTPRIFEAFAVTAVTDTSIELELPITQDYEKPIVMPIRLSRLTSAPTRSTNAHNGLLETSFEAIDNTRLASTPITTYNDIEVYLDRPLREGRFIPDNYLKDVNPLDFGNKLEIFSHWDFTRITRKFKVILQGLEEIYAFKEFMHRRRGKQVPFYMPTFERNLRVINVGQVVGQINIVNDENELQASERRTIAVLLKNGNWLFRGITTIDMVDATTINVFIDVDLNVDVSEIDTISYMGLKRLTSDSFELEWFQNYVAQTSISIVEISP